MKKINFDIDLKNTDEEIDQMYQEYLSCPKVVKIVNDMGIDDETAKKYIVKIYDFVQDFNYCQHCPGIENCKKANPLLQTRLTYELGVVDRDLVPCPKMLDEVKKQGNYLFRDFPDSYNLNTIRDIDKDRSKLTICNYFKNFANGKSKKWLYIYGQPNLGKTFIMAALTNNYVNQNKGTVAFINAKERFQQLENYYRDKNYYMFNSNMDAYYNADLLIIDDFGKEYKSDLIREDVLFEILKYRLENRLMTIFVSEFSIGKVADMYNTKKSAVDTAQHIYDIIKKTTNVVNLKGLSNLY